MAHGAHGHWTRGRAGRGAYARTHVQRRDFWHSPTSFNAQALKHASQCTLILPVRILPQWRLVPLFSTQYQSCGARSNCQRYVQHLALGGLIRLKLDPGDYSWRKISRLSTGLTLRIPQCSIHAVARGHMCIRSRPVRGPRRQWVLGGAEDGARHPAFFGLMTRRRWSHAITRARGGQERCS
jgi:hypothetical protein